MSENCTHDCSNCTANCGERKDPHALREPCNARARVGRVIAVVSGKGGVGKSMVTALLASEMRRRGYKVGVLDADVTGPSMPKAFGVNEQPLSDGEVMFPVETASGIQMMSCNLLLPKETAPVLWRGPIIAGMVKQFWTDVCWDVDFLFVDLPPGTGDVPLTVFQTLPVDETVVVTSPQSLVGMIVEKAVNMASMMAVPVTALVENFSFVRCPGCGEILHPFGVTDIGAEAERLGIPMTAALPIDPALAAACDQGKIEQVGGGLLGELADHFEGKKPEEEE